MNTFFLDRLNSEPHALAFAGQSTPWPVALADQSANPALDEALHTHAAAAQALLYPVSAELLATTGRPVDLFGFEPNPARLGAAAAASASVPGIALTHVQPGDTVEENQVLMTIEAMKMETAVTARTAGKVREIRVKEGQAVKAKELLMLLD